jgi:hypothetical protein
MNLGWLFLILLLIYFLQCICWATPGSVVFALGLRGRGKRRQEFVWNALNVSGLLAGPLPPLTPLLVVQWPAFELTPDSIRFASKEGEPVSLPWEKLKIAYSESRLRCNDSLVFKGSETQVKQYAGLLQQLQRAARGQRGQIIQDWLRKAMSIQSATRRVLTFSRRSRVLRVISNLQFVFLFFVVPLGFEKFGTGIFWRVILMLVAISAAAGVEFWGLHKLLFLAAKEERFKSGVTIFLSPIAAIRASDVLAHNLLGGFHPLAAAGAVLSEEEFRQFAAQQLRLNRYGDYLDQRYQQMVQQAMEQSIRNKGLNPEELLRPPEPEPGCVVYCPRCLAQYTKPRTECVDCGYEELASFASVAQPPSART